MGGGRISEQGRKEVRRVRIREPGNGGGGSGNQEVRRFRSENQEMGGGKIREPGSGEG